MQELFYLDTDSNENSDAENKSARSDNSMTRVGKKSMMLDASTLNQIGKIGSPAKKAKEFNPLEYLKKIQIHQNSYMFVNDRDHIRHKKPKKNQNKIEEWKINIGHIYQTVSAKKFLTSDQQAQMNNEYDYSITQMFRIFLK